MESGDQSDYDYRYNTSQYGDYDFEEDSDLSDIECQMYPEFQVALLIYSILVLILYVALQKRVKLKSKLLSGYFGLPIPINFVHETKDRWVYAAVFGAQSGTFVQLVFNGNLVSPQGFIDSILRGFILFLTMLFIPLLFFAMIASVHGRIQVLTHAIGLAYVGTALAQQILLCIDCHQVASTIEQGIYQTFQYVDIYGTVIPIMLCNVLTGIYFLVRGAQAVTSIITGKPFTFQKDVQHHLGYVKLLLARNSITEPPNNPKATEKLAILFKRYVYKRDPYFKYPVRLLCITSVVVVGLLVVTVQLLSLLITTVRFVEDSVAVGNESDVVKRLIDVAYAFAVIIPIISYSITVLSFLLSIKAYKDHCKRIWKGDDFFKPIRKATPANILVRSTFYVGWQIGMVLWAWLFYVILMIILIVTIVIVVLVLVYVPEIREWLAWRAILLASTTITGLIFTVVQGLIARYLFAKGKTLIVNNSRLFHIYTYFLLFYNALIGMGKAMRRIFTSAVISLFFLPRLDRSLLIEGFHKLDKGYIAYLSAVRLDAAYNNPVLNVFVYLLSKERTSYNTTSFLDRFTVQNYYQDTQINTVHPDEYKLKPMKSKARKMWYLAYTLVRNPDLLELRRRLGTDSRVNTIVQVTSKNSDTTDFGIANELAEQCDDNNSKVKEDP